MTPEEFLKKEGYFNSPHFPFDHVAGLMYRYAQSQHDGKPIVSGSLPPAHAEMLVLAIDEFLPKEHPIRHHSSYRAIRKTLIDSGVIGGNDR